MKISPTTLTLQQFFSVSNEQFLVPAYQRRYAWGKKQQREFFDDIRLLHDGDTHLLGTVLFLSSTHSPRLNQMELVDGQQRVTTITLLLSTIANRFEADDDGETAKEIRKLLQCKAMDGKINSKLLLGDLDHNDYKSLIEDGDTSESSNQSLTDAFLYFESWIDDLDEQEVNNFYHKLMNSVTIIRLDVGEAKDAYKLFETINNRGLRLRPTDIIKNFLLGHASAIDQDTLNKVKDNWRRLIVALDGYQGQRFVAGYTDNENLLIRIPGPVIVFGDHTTARKFIDFDFVAGADGVKILRPIAINEKFFWLQLMSLKLEGRGYARHYKVLNECLFALPPIREQARIVTKVNELMVLCDQLRSRITDLNQHQKKLADVLVERAAEE